MEGTNTFSKGLHRSNSPMEQPEGSYVDALNWIRNDSGRLINEEVEKLIQSFNDAVSYKYLGSCSVQDSFIVFFQQLGNDGNLYSEIGIFNNNNPTLPYTRVFNDYFTNPVYRLNFNNSIDSVAKINNKEEIVVYFVEEGNVPRRFNITEFETTGKYSSLSYNNLTDWSLQLNLKLPYAVLDIENNGGSIPSGAYSVIFRYRTDINNKSVFGIPSRVIYITDDVGETTNSDGCPPGTQTTKSIKITPTNVDSNYPYIEPIIITYVGLTNVLTIKSLGLYSNNGTDIYFRDESQYKDSVSLEEINENPIYYDSAKCIEQKDNILILSNLTGKKYDRGFQDIVNNIRVTFYYDNTYTVGGADFPADWFELNGSTGLSGTGTYKNRGFIKGVQDTKNSTTNSFLKETNANFPYKNGLDKKGFARGEIYSLSITPIYKDGSIGFAYHIPAVPHTTFDGFNTTDVYISEERYPNYLLNDSNFPYNSTVSDGKIRHHRMPDYTGVGGMRCLSVERGILKLRVNNILFTDAQKAAIQGYIIGYQPRNSDINTKIVDSGWVKPYLANGNFLRNSFFNGSSYFQFSNKADMTFFPQGKGLMYHSPDTEGLGKKLNKSYKVQIYGWARERNPATNYVFYTTFPQNADSDTGVFWDHYQTEGNPSPLYNLEEVIEIAAIGEQNKTILGKYRIEFSKFYYHLETELINGNSVLAAANWGAYYNPPTYKFQKVKEDNGVDDLRKVFYVRNAMSYIPLARIINNINFQYGKLENAEYIPSEVVLDPNFTSSEIEGDIFLTKYFHHNLDGFRNNFTGGGYDGNDDSSLFHYYAGIWYESQNNYAFRHYDAITNEVPYYPKLKTLHVESGGGKGLIDYEWWKRAFGYNKQYSAINNFKTQFSRPLFFDEVTDYSNRSIYSKQSFENELVDQYRSFPSLQYHDIPKHRGVITDTFVFSNNFFHHTEYGLWLSFFNPNTIQSTSQGDIVLGNAGIFKIPSKLILDTKGGYMGTMDKSGTNTPFGRVFLDHKQGKIFLFAGESPVEISDLGLFEFFREFVNTNDKYSMGYDWANKRLLISRIANNKQQAISFYPKTQTWTSFHDFVPVEYFTTNGYSYAYNNNEFFNFTNSNGLRKNSYVTFVENTQPDAFKRFDRIEINTMSGGNQGIFDPGAVLNTNDYIFKDKSFSKIHCWTDRQNSTELDFAYEPNHDYNTNFLNSYNPALVPANYYKSSFHAELPLDAVVDPYLNIFDNNNLNINGNFRAHMKGKFLYTKLSYNDTSPLVLNYIKTIFKSSVA